MGYTHTHDEHKNWVCFHIRVCFLFVHIPVMIQVMGFFFLCSFDFDQVCICVLIYWISKSLNFKTIKTLFHNSKIFWNLENMIWVLIYWIHNEQMILEMEFSSFFFLKNELRRKINFWPEKVAGKLMFAGEDDGNRQKPTIPGHGMFKKKV